MPNTFVRYRSVPLLWLAAGCAHAPAPNRAVLIAADQEFERAADRHGAAGWKSFFAPDAVALTSTGQIDNGADTIGESAKKTFADPAFKLRWHPDYAEIARSGELGYTYGHWRAIRLNGPADSTELARGTYATVWRRLADGSWKVVLDTGNEEPKPN